MECDSLPREEREDWSTNGLPSTILYTPKISINPMTPVFDETGHNLGYILLEINAATHNNPKFEIATPKPSMFVTSTCERNISENYSDSEARIIVR